MFTAIRMTRKFSALSLAILSLLLPGRVQAATALSGTAMTPVFSQAGAFSVLMPGQPATTVKAVKTAIGPIDAHSFLVETGGGAYAYMVVYNDYPTTPANPQRVLNAVRDGGVESVRGRVISERAIALDGHPGKEVVIEAEDHVFINRMYIAGQRLYQVMFAMHKNASLPQEVRVFFSSFRIHS
jgi:hypothetical protein